MRKSEFLEYVSGTYWNLQGDFDRLNRKIKSMDNPPDIQKELREIDSSLTQLQCLIRDYGGYQ